MTVCPVNANRFAFNLEEGDCMSLLTIKVINAAEEVLAMRQAVENVSLLYEGSYAPEDRIVLETDTPGQFYVIHLEDTLAPALVYLAEQTLVYSIPYGDDRLVFSPKSFMGERHLLRARLATAQLVVAAIACANAAVGAVAAISAGGQHQLAAAVSTVAPHQQSIALCVQRHIAVLLGAPCHERLHLFMARCV